MMIYESNGQVPSIKPCFSENCPVTTFVLEGIRYRFQGRILFSTELNYFALSHIFVFPGRHSI
tara:strand:+ start:82 stop:270 length:189 start_codon:yes stop_codon:yes gene_type:complete